MIEKVFEKLFDIRKIPVKLVFVIWVSCGIVLFSTDNFLMTLNLIEFKKEYGKFIGISFIVASALLVVAIITSIVNAIDRKKYHKEIEKDIIKALNNLDSHEKALLREFAICGKSTLQLPMDSETVVGLCNKRILYQASNTGFKYIHGAYFPFSITEFASENLNFKLVDLPEQPTDADREKILNARPQWAKEKSHYEDRWSRWSNW